MSNRTLSLRRPRAAFTLIELLVVITIITALVGSLGYLVLSAYLIREATRKEDAALAALARDIEQSFDARELSTVNVGVASNPGMVSGGSPTDDLDGSITAATFSTSTAPSYTAITGNEWFARVARARSLSVTAGQAVSKSVQPALYDILFTAGDRPRLLIRGPSEAHQQRYLLISVIGRSDELVLPPYQSSQAWFDDLWNTPWERSDATLPATWTSALSADQAATWNTDSPGKSRLPRLRRVKITQRRDDLVINCLHPTDQVWVAYNTLTNYTPGVTSAPPTNFLAGSGASTISGLLEGRVVRIYVGQTWATAKLVEQTIRGRTVYTAQ